MNRKMQPAEARSARATVSDERINLVRAFAQRVWENDADAEEWLNRRHLELQDATPISLLGTEEGCRRVEAVLAALEYGFPV
jgi:putative toxin-antitoxin system antitoxin component (TIGR02293 family)